MRSSGWYRGTLNDLCEVVMGQSPKGETCNSSGLGLPLLNGPTEFGNTHPSPRQYTTDAKRKCRVGDVLFCVRGSTTGRMNWADREYAIGRGLAAVRHKCGSQYQHFIKAALDHGKELLLKSATGSTFPSINKDLLLSMPVQIPPLPIQKAIAGTLSCLDTKIELNNRINENLEAQAQAVFKSWFVDFEPFQDGEFVESELGLIPEGWRVGTISDLGEVIGGSTPSKKVNEYYGDQGIPWITPKDLSLSKTKFVARGQVDITEEGLRNSSTRIIPKGTVLFSSRAPIGYIAIAKNEVTTNQGFKSVVPKASVGTEYTYCFLKNNIDTIEARASGSTFKEVSGAIMKRVPALIPSEEILEKFTAATCSIFRLQETLEEQNLNLASLRDTLLPKLMSGEIEVPVE